MAKTSFSLENDAARAELNQLVNELDVGAYSYSVGSSGTIASSLCHLAFWDLRVLFLLGLWQRSGSVTTPRLDAQSIDSINHAVNAIALQVPGRAAMRLVPDSAAAVDACIAEVGEELAEKIRAAGFDRYLRRSLHRREHLQKIRGALDAQAK